MRGTISIVVYLAIFTIAVAWLISFGDFVLPVVYPSLLEGRFWAIWLVVGVFIGPLAFLIGYACVKATESRFNQWRYAIIAAFLAFLYLSALAFIFSIILPSDFEPFRSLTLPSVILALTFIVIGRTKYAKRFRQY